MSCKKLEHCEGQRIFRLSDCQREPVVSQMTRLVAAMLELIQMIVRLESQQEAETSNYDETPLGQPRACSRICGLF
jgi:hypothetical protein